MDDWWAPIIWFPAAWGLIQLTERNRQRMAQAVTRRTVVAELRHAVQMIRDALGVLKAGPGQWNQAAVMTRGARGRRAPPRPEAR